MSFMVAQTFLGMAPTPDTPQVPSSRPFVDPLLTSYQKGDDNSPIKKTATVRIPATLQKTAPPSQPLRPKTPLTELYTTKIAPPSQHVADLPLSYELLDYYRSRCETSEKEFQDHLAHVESIRIQQEEFHRQQWELHKRNIEIASLQDKLSDAHNALFQERTHLFRVIAENDALKVQELKDRKKIKYLLACTGLPESETTYLRDALSKKLIKIASGKQMEQPDQTMKDERDLVILEDELEANRLLLESALTQIEEQRAVYEETIAHLHKDRTIKVQEEKARRQHDMKKIEDGLAQVEKLRSLCRENTRELLSTKKEMQKKERKLMEDKTIFIHEIQELKQVLTEQKDKATNVEKLVEIKVVKRQETLLSDLRGQLGRLEEENRQLKNQLTQLDTQHKKKQDVIKQKCDALTTSYVSLRRRRDFEIEGFTNDILMLRKQLRQLEKSILKYGPLEDKELVLLDMARQTGLKADKISTNLTHLKAKVYSMDEQLRSIPV